MSFQLVGRTMTKKGLHHLGIRECALGGYNATVVSFQGAGADGTPTSRAALVFIATPTNPYYCGGASPPEELANKIIWCLGRSGHNVEYVTRLADFVRKYIPQDRDPHLFDLDTCLRRILRKNQDWLQTVLQSTRRKDTRQLRTIMAQRLEDDGTVTDS